MGFASRIWYLNQALRDSEKAQNNKLGNDHELLNRILQKGPNKNPVWKQAFIERPVGSYEEVAQKNGIAVELCGWFLAVHLYNFYLHILSWYSMKKFIEDQ